MTPLEAIEKLSGQPVLVLGDMIADIYLYGTIARISREAPVLVLEQSTEKIVAGGAANVINNGATLGGRIFAAGLVGDDNAAKGLSGILREKSVDVSGFIKDANRSTISKTRIVAGGRTTVSQQIVRVDKESKEPMGKAQEQQLEEYLKQVLPQVKGVVLSDYGSGTITDKLLGQIFAYCQEHNIPTIVDSRYDILRFKTVDYIKQNDAELSAAIGRDLATEEELVQGGCELLLKMSAKGALITRGEDGMSLFQIISPQEAADYVKSQEASGSVDAGQFREGLTVKLVVKRQTGRLSVVQELISYQDRDILVSHIPVTDKSEVYDVSGAGDTCVATVILGLAAGLEPLLASLLSNEASGIAVRKMGTSVVYARELEARFRQLGYEA